MLHLLHPAALWTLTALALPLTIHLWRPPPRTVRLGSLRFLENVSRRPLRRLRWRELILLCTRLGLLAVLSLLLAQPRWTSAPPAGPRRWALLDPTASLGGESLAHWRQAQRDGYELRRLAPGFPPAFNDFSPNSAAGNAAAPDLWSFLREADAELPAGSTLAVFSPVRLEALRGVRPTLGHCKTEWVQTPDAADGLPHEWVASVSGQRVLMGHSDARSTVFTLKPPADPAVSPPTPSATSILILHDTAYANDALYVEAAARAAADSIEHPVNLQNREITPDTENAAAADWMFWLSAQTVPEALAGRSPRIVRYAVGDPVAGEDWIVAPPGDAADGTHLWKRTAAESPGPIGTVLWSDGQGNPVLTYARSGAGECWDFYTRFDPGWTDLPRTTALAASMRALLFPEAVALSDAGPFHDRRLADPAQGRISEAPSPTIPVLTPVDQPSRDLWWPVWIAAALLFVVERMLSLRRRATPLPAPHMQPELVAASR